MSSKLEINNPPSNDLEFGTAFRNHKFVSIDGSARLYCKTKSSEIMETQTDILWSLNLRISKNDRCEIVHRSQCYLVNVDIFDKAL